MHFFSKPCLTSWGLAAALLFVAGPVSAERPEKLRGWVKKVHKPIVVKKLDQDRVRLAVLQGMFFTRGYSWQLEKETGNTITTRFDYRGDAIILDIVYSADQVYINFVDGNGFECRELVEGVCFKNDRGYYNYAKNLRKSIEDQIKIVRRMK